MFIAAPLQHFENILPCRRTAAHISAPKDHQKSGICSVYTRHDQYTVTDVKYMNGHEYRNGNDWTLDRVIYKFIGSADKYYFYFIRKR